MKKLSLLLLLLFPGCGLTPPPQIDCRILGCSGGSHCALVESAYVCVPDETLPPPSPAVCPECGHGTQCTDPAVGCVPIPAPGPVCAPASQCGCWVFPPDEPTWRELTCTPPLVCTENQNCVDVVTPPPPPPPVVGCVPDPEDPAWGKPIPPDVRATQLFAEYQQALADAGGPWTTGPNGTEDAQMASLARIAAAWRNATGRCVEQWADSVAVKADDGRFEEWHAVYFGNGQPVNSPGAYKGAWPYNAEVTGCSYPLPDRTKLKINAKPYFRYVDATLKTAGTCGYCEEIGMAPQCNCPMRNECPGVKCEERVACEAYASQGTVWQTDPPGHPVELHDGNPWQASSDPGVKLRVCVVDLSVCSPWVDQP